MGTAGDRLSRLQWKLNFQHLTTVVASKLDGELMMRAGKGDFAHGDDLGYEAIKTRPDHFRWSMRVNENGKPYNVLFVCALTVSPYKLTNNDKYPNIIKDERSTLHKLRSMPNP